MAETIIWKYCVLEVPTDEFILPEGTVILDICRMAHGGLRVFFVAPKENYFYK